MPSATEPVPASCSGKGETYLHDATESLTNEPSVQRPSLPIEVLCYIVTYVQKSGSAQRDKWAMTMVSRSWYAAAVAPLYHKPNVSGKNFGLFVRTLCPSINAHIRKTSFSTMVKELDMSKLVHDSSKSLTSRILGRLKDGLEVFVAPQASFAINCLAALSKCQHLHQLDLSYVSENLALSQLLRSVTKLSQLEELSIRCTLDHNSDIAPSNVQWPPRLKALHFSGPIHDDHLGIFSTLPKSLTSLTLHHCPKLSNYAFRSLMADLGDVLETFHFGPRTSHVMLYGDLVECLDYAPKLQRLLMPATDYSIRTGFLPKIPVRYNAQNPHPLEHLILDCTAFDGYGIQLDYEDLWFAIAEGYLGRVRRLGFCHQVNVPPWMTEKRELRDLDDLLRALAREDGANASTKEEDAGVYVYTS